MCINLALPRKCMQEIFDTNLTGDRLKYMCTGGRGQMIAEEERRWRQKQSYTQGLAGYLRLQEPSYVSHSSPEPYVDTR